MVAKGFATVDVDVRDGAKISNRDVDVDVDEVVMGEAWHCRKGGGGQRVR